MMFWHKMSSPTFFPSFWFWWLFCCFSLQPQQNVVVYSQVEFECQVKSPVADFVTSYTLCLDSDPVPSIYEDVDTSMNFFINAAQSGGLYFRDLGGGHVVAGDGVYQSSLYIYRKGNDDDDETTSDETSDYSTTSIDDSSSEGSEDERRLDDSDEEAEEEAEEEEEEEGEEAGPARGVYTHGAIMVDAPKNYGEEFGHIVKEYLATNYDAELTIFIATHAHIDHIGNWYRVVEANPTMTYHIASKDISETLFKLQIPNYSNCKVQNIMGAKAHEFPNFEVDQEITGPTELRFGKEGSSEQIILQVRPMKGHQDGNLLIFHEASKTLTHIDSLAFPKWSPFFESAQKTNLPALFETFDILREYDYDFFIGGHLTHLGTPEDVVVSEQFFVDILDAAYRVVQPGIDRNAYVNAFDIAVELGVFDSNNNDANFGNIFLFIGEYFNRARVSCAKIVLNPNRNYSGISWITTLGAVRVTLLSHCDDAIESVRIDAPGEP